MKLAIPLLIALTTLAPAAHAQSSLGLTFATLGVSTDDTSDKTAQAQADVAITPYHGLQGDLGLSQFADTEIGYIAGHLYLAPEPGQKYGFFAAYRDINDTASTLLDLGIEGTIDLTPDLALTAHAGVGQVKDRNLDYVFAGAGLGWRASENLWLTADLSGVDIDQVGLQSTAATLRVAGQYDIPNSAISLTMGAAHSRFSGDLSGSEDRFFVGLTVTLGQSATSARTRPLNAPDPLAPYWRTGRLRP
ncbi:MAG: hypothetical protein MRY67_12350 [Rhodovulum sp.]|jgi:hypothetical protein|nr:hypothetical protein [Rhodovulum sp.]MCI5086704.1 hypothetical protein [Rhodovulum sp.]